MIELCFLTSLLYLASSLGPRLALDMKKLIPVSGAGEDRRGAFGAVLRPPACHGLGWRGRRPRYGDQGPAAHTRVTEHFTITEKAPARVFSWLKAPTSAFTFKKLLRHYAKQTLTPR